MWRCYASRIYGIETTGYIVAWYDEITHLVILLQERNMLFICTSAMYQNYVRYVIFCSLDIMYGIMTNELVIREIRIDECTNLTSGPDLRHSIVFRDSCFMCSSFHHEHFFDEIQKNNYTQTIGCVHL